ncbi:MAG: hypothetical protein L0I24_06160 [Pseudonocardia sp.]|nr:hypothetical protein [Pseudonocardia sp.]
MPRLTLWHQHEPGECSAAFAAWRGVDSPLRHGTALASCLTGTHTVCWTVDAAGPAEALAMLPPFVAARSRVLELREVTIP